MTMSYQRFTPRADHRKHEGLRTQESGTLLDTYPDLKSLTVEFVLLTAEGLGQKRPIKYTVDPAHAKAVFLLDCPNPTCIRGDFDLSGILAKAVSGHQTQVVGDMRCKGWLNKAMIDQTPCHHLLKYQLFLGYHPHRVHPESHLPDTLGTPAATLDSAPNHFTPLRAKEDQCASRQAGSRTSRSDPTPGKIPGALTIHGVETSGAT